jgi:uncharacterized membrane protein YqgA involved in biofilm formation
MEGFALWGSLVNAIGIVGGALVGVGAAKLTGGTLKTGEMAENTRGRRLTAAISLALALCVVMIGIGGMLKGAMNDAISNALPLLMLPGEKTLVILFSMLIGTVVGTLLDLEARFERFGVWVERRFGGQEGGIAKGFVTASLLFCVGSMAIVGALDGGLVGDHSLLYAKTVLDTVFAVVFAYSMGIGVALSAVLVLLYQGSIALLAQWVAPLLTDDVIITMSVVGSVLIFGLGLKLLGLLKIKVLNHVPAVFVPIALVPLFEWMGL